MPELAPDQASEGAPASAIATWFDDGPQPALRALQCTVCGNKVFPPRALICPNPACSSTDFESVHLGRLGTLWSFTDAQYAPPPPYPRTEGPWEPFPLLAVEITDDKMIVLGQAAPGVGLEDLTVGMPMELSVGSLTDGTAVWNWKPAGGTS
jgi:uncharacterized OB-fold protein